MWAVHTTFAPKCLLERMVEIQTRIRCVPCLRNGPRSMVAIIIRIIHIKQLKSRMETPGSISSTSALCAKTLSYGKIDILFSQRIGLMSDKMKGDVKRMTMNLAQLEVAKLD